MKQQNGKWYERYSVTPHPLGTMFTLWGIRGIVPEALGDYPSESEAQEVMEKLKAEDKEERRKPRLNPAVRLAAFQHETGQWVVKSDGCLWVVIGGAGRLGDEAYANLFAASPKLLAFAEAYLEAVEDAEGDGDEVEALARMADQARAAVDEARGRV